MRKQWIACLFFVAFAAAGFAAPAAPKKATATPAKTAAEKVTSVEGITEYDLSNGLRVLLFPDQTKPTVVINLTYLVGSRHESYGETGMAHLLEHMMFRSTAPTTTLRPGSIGRTTSRSFRPPTRTFDSHWSWKRIG
jgi:predicted Zn-dependent peptidase